MPQPAILQIGEGCVLMSPLILSPWRPIASALTQSEDADSVLSLARMEAADAFQTNGLGLALCSAR